MAQAFPALPALLGQPTEHHLDVRGRFRAERSATFQQPTFLNIGVIEVTKNMTEQTLRIIA